MIYLLYIRRYQYRYSINFKFIIQSIRKKTTSFYLCLGFYGMTNNLMEIFFDIEPKTPKLTDFLVSSLNENILSF